MRIRIIRPPVGFIDGVEVSLFKPGAVYDVPAALATCLVVEGWAECETTGSERADQRSLTGLREIRALTQSLFPLANAADRRKGD
jgi:hypothetical protein